MAYIKMKKNGESKLDINLMTKKLKKELGGSTFLNLISRKIGEYSVYMLSFEELFLRTEGFVSLTILFIETEKGLTADIVTSSGAEGALFLSWGATKSYAKSAEKILIKEGFVTEDTILFESDRGLCDLFKNK